MRLNDITNIKITVFLSLFFAAFSLTAHAAPGDLDASFGIGGKVVTSLDNPSYDHAYAAAFQADGKILVAGDTSSGDSNIAETSSSFSINRINTDGSLDRSFGFNGTATKYLPDGGRITALLVQPDGKIIAGGYSLAYNSNFLYVFGFLLARFNSNGTIDNTFGTNGINLTPISDFNDGDRLTGLALQADGKIVAVGYGGTSIVFVVARYNPDGTFDTTFDGDGKLIFNFTPTSTNRATSVAIQTDGKIVIGGYAATPANISIINFALVRLNANGSFDTTFDGDGKLTTIIGTARSQANALKIQPDGKIVAAGQSGPGSTRDVTIIRYNPDGSLDTTFDGDGIVFTDIGDEVANSLVVQTDGKIVVGGFTVPPGLTVSSLSVRYNSNGSLDTSYNGNGKVFTNLSPYGANSMATLVQSDGKVVSAGSRFTVISNDILLTRTNADGSPDASFDGDGVSIIELNNSREIIYDTAIQPDGKIIASGYTNNELRQNFLLVRYNPNGTLDMTFGNQGKVIMPSNDYSSGAGEVAVQPDGKIVANLILYEFDGTAHFRTVRFNPDGSPDASFGTAGMVSFELGNAAAFRLALEPDGKIVLAGGSNSSVALARLNSDGSLDATFGTSGTVVTNTANRDTFFNAITVQPDGKIVVVGSSRLQGESNYTLFVSRYNLNGSLDGTFGGTGTIYTAATAKNDSASVVKIQTDNKIVVAGYDDDGYILVRYNPDGSLDTTFDGDGKVFTLIRAGSFSYVNDLAIQQNGKIIIVGFENDIETTATILRYNGNGSLDATFGSGGIIFQTLGYGSSAFSAVSLQTDGKIIAGGYSNNGASDDITLVRYQGDATTATRRALFDYDGDGKSDLSVFRPSNGVWYLNQSQNGFTYAAFGLSGDAIAPADYDGDGKTDLAVFRPSNGTWYLLRSSLGFTAVQFGASGDLPMPADFDGDGKAELAIFRPSTGVWYQFNLVNNQTNTTAFGLSGDVPAASDYDGDGKADIAVFRPSNGTWYLLRSTAGFTAIQFGADGDKPVVGDYDGDGKADLAVWRPSNGVWYLQRSMLGFAYSAFGLTGDLPAPGDYDGDGKTDLGIFRPSSGIWYLQRSTQGFTAIQFGASGDKPTPNAYVP